MITYKREYATNCLVDVERGRRRNMREDGDREIKKCTSRMKDISNLADTEFMLGDSVCEQAIHILSEIYYSALRVAY